MDRLTEAEESRLPGRSATDALATEVASFRLTAASDAACTVARRLTVDTAACALAALELPAGRLHADSASLFGAQGPVGLWGRNTTTGPAAAAFVHGNLANLLDADETFRNVTHIAAAVVPAVLALAQTRPSSGADVIAAVIAGYEAGARLAAALPNHQARQDADLPRLEWSLSAGQSWLALAAAAAGARLLGLDAVGTARAMGAAAYCAPLPTLGRWAHSLPMAATKYILYGGMAAAGVVGVHFASQGMQSDHDILDADSGFWKMSGALRFDQDPLHDPFGAPWSIEEAAFKPYPCSRQLHAALDAVQECVAEVHAAGATTQAIESIEIGVHAGLLGHPYDNARPRNAIEASFSLAHAAAMIVLDVPPGPQWLSASTLDRADVQAIVQRTRIHEEPLATTLVTRQMAELAGGYRETRSTAVLLVGGRGIRHQVSHPAGDREHPIPFDVESKFRRFASGVLGPQAIDTFIEGSRVLESMADVRPWLACLGKA